MSSEDQTEQSGWHCRADDGGCGGGGGERGGAAALLAEAEDGVGKLTTPSFKCCLCDLSAGSAYTKPNRFSSEQRNPVLSSTPRTKDDISRGRSLAVWTPSLDRPATHHSQPTLSPSIRKLPKATKACSARHCRRAGGPKRAGFQKSEAKSNATAT